MTRDKGKEGQVAKGNASRKEAVGQARAKLAQAAKRILLESMDSQDGSTRLARFVDANFNIMVSKTVSVQFTREETVTKKFVKVTRTYEADLVHNVRFSIFEQLVRREFREGGGHYKSRGQLCPEGEEPFVVTALEACDVDPIVPVKVQDEEIPEPVI